MKEVFKAGKLHQETWEQILAKVTPAYGDTFDTIIRKAVGLPEWSGEKQPVGRPKTASGVPVSGVPTSGVPTELDDWHNPDIDWKGIDEDGRKWIIEAGEKIYVKPTEYDNSQT